MNKRLFLASSFKDVVSIFKKYVNEELKGKTVTYIPTAFIPYPQLLKFLFKLLFPQNKKILEDMGLTVDLLEITETTEKEISNKLLENDYIFIAGGNTFFLLQELKKTGADKIIFEQINFGKLYIGESAGSIILSPNIEYIKEMDDYKKAPDLNDFTALNLVDFYPLPHQNTFGFKKIVNKIIAKYKSTLNLYPFTDTQAILVNGNDIRVETNS